VGKCDNERRYIGSNQGGKAVFERSINNMWDDGFRALLDAKLDIIPFDNGAYELSSATFRPLRWDDYVVKKIGYDYVPSEHVPVEHRALVDRFFEQVLPVVDERELVLTMLGSALSGRLDNKKFLVLQDERGGDNGKSMVVRAMEAAFGSLCMRKSTRPSQRQRRPSWSATAPRRTRRCPSWTTSTSTRS
jgi:hypothetical protein